MSRASASLGMTMLLVVCTVLACSGSAPPTPSPTPVPTASPSPTPSPTPSPSPTGTPATPRPTSPAPAAYNAMEAYVQALIDGRYIDAWFMLGPACRARWGSMSAFTKDRSARLKASGPEYVLRANPKTLPLSSWLIGTSWGSEVDAAHAFLFSVRWTGYGTDPTGTEIWIASQTITGWDLYLAS
jgi:hypothetical protein